MAARQALIEFGRWHPHKSEVSVNRPCNKTAIGHVLDMELNSGIRKLAPLATAVAGLFGVATAGLWANAALAAAPPSPGEIQKSIQAPAPLPVPPGAVIAIPEPKQQKSALKVLIAVRSISIRGNTLLPASQLHDLVKDAEGKSLTLGDLDARIARITDAYHRAGYPLAYAYLPAQAIHDGKVVVEVVEPKYGRVSVGGHSRLRAEVAKRTVGVAPGQFIEESSLSRGLILLSQTPGVKAHAVFSPGEKPLTSDLRLDIEDTPVFSGQLFANNSGNRAAGNTLIGGSGNWSNPFGYGSAMSLTAMGSPGASARLGAGAVSLDSPYIWHGLRVGAYGSSTYYHLGSSFAALKESGRMNQFGVDSTYPLVLAPGKILVARLDLQKNWYSQTTGATSTYDAQNIALARIGLSGSYADLHGGVTQGNVTLSHGNLKLSQADAQALDAAGPRTAGTFNVLAYQLAHLQPLPGGFAVLAKVSGQLADKNLDSSQKFYLGGPNGVIAYEVGDGGGDDGYLVDLELSHPLLAGNMSGRLTGSLLAQGGNVRVNHANYAGFGSPNSLTETGIGIKLDYALNSWRANASYGWRIGPYANSGAASDHAGQFWLSVSKSF